MKLRFRKTLQDTLHDFVAGDLDEAEARAIRQRIEQDPDIRAQHDQIREAHEALLTLRERPEPPTNADAVLPLIQAAIARDQFVQRPRLYLESGSSRFYRRVAMAASLLLVVSVSLMFALRGSGQPLPEIAAPPAATTPAAPERELVPIDALVEAGGELDAAKLFELLEKYGRDPRELRFTPSDVVPVAAGSAAERR